MNSGASTLPAVSVIVVTYNQEKYIRTCLDSILAQQTSFAFEIVLGEDNSTDNTREICRWYAEEYPHIIQLRLQDRSNVIFIDGYPTGRYNILDCMKHARGKFIAFCEGDDYWKSTDKLQQQMEIMMRDSLCAGSYHDTLIAQGEQETDQLFRKEIPDSLSFRDTIARTSPFHTSSFFTRTEWMQMPEFASEVTSFDMMLFSLAAQHGPLKRAENIYSVYRKHDGGLTSNSALIQNYHRKRIVLMEKMKSHFKRDADKFDEVIAYHRHEMPAQTQESGLLFKIKNRLRKLLK